MRGPRLQPQLSASASAGSTQKPPPRPAPWLAPRVFVLAAAVAPIVPRLPHYTTPVVVMLAAAPHAPKQLPGGIDGETPEVIFLEAASKPRLLDRATASLKRRTKALPELFGRLASKARRVAAQKIAPSDDESKGRSYPARRPSRRRPRGRPARVAPSAGRRRYSRVRLLLFAARIDERSCCAWCDARFCGDAQRVARWAPRPSRTVSAWTLLDGAFPRPRC